MTLQLTVISWLFFCLYRYLIALGCVHCDLLSAYWYKEMKKLLNMYKENNIFVYTFLLFSNLNSVILYSYILYELQILCIIVIIFGTFYEFLKFLTK